MRQGERQIGDRGLLQLARGTFKKLTELPKRTKMQHVDIGLMAGEEHQGAEHFESYGWTSRPKEGAEVVVVYANGNRAHPIVLCIADRRYRLQGLEEGEVALHDDQGQSVVIRRDQIEVKTDKKVLAQVKDMKFAVKPDRIDLGDDPAPFRVMTEAGPSQKVWAIIS